MSDEKTTEGEDAAEEAAKPKRGRKPMPEILDGEAAPVGGNAGKWKAKRDNTLRGRYFRKGETLEWAGKDAPSEHFERID